MEMSEKYGWIIDKDCCDEADEATGVTGPRGGLSVPAGKGERFEMFDDDENLMAYGRIVGEYVGFEPIDDIGAGYWGCTLIAYRGEYL
tara:strand:- start:165 stop:428 length:264 start_codon:yes stop_codon:yes gene_type:complete